MSDYFNKLPDFQYTSLLENSSIGDKVTVKNLFRRAKLRDDIFQNVSYFNKYAIIGDERPDQIAQKIYKDPNLDWVILLSNNILNYQTEWPLSSRAFNEYILEKYGSYENASKPRFYESKRVFNSRNETVFPFGLKVPENFAVEFYDIDIDRYVRLTDVSYPVTNLVYEERIQEKKRNIFILQPLYLNIVFEDMKDILPYKKGSTEFISKTLKDTEIIFN
jgi:hypothetical protein